jgi:hypothetical protein
MLCWSRERAVKVEDIFIGYHADCAASTVLQVCQQMGLSNDIKDDNMANEVGYYFDSIFLHKLSDSFLSLCVCNINFFDV